MLGAFLNLIAFVGTFNVGSQLVDKFYTPAD